MDIKTISFILFDSFLTGFYFALPFWIIRFIYQTPIKKISAFLFVILYSCSLSFILTYLAYGYYDTSVMILPYLWILVSFYFLTARDPLFIPNRKKLKVEKLAREENIQLPFFRSSREKLFLSISIILLIGCLSLAYHAFYLEQEIASLESTVYYYEYSMQDESQVTEYVSDKQKEKAEFLDEHVAIIGDNDRYYHSYGCPNCTAPFLVLNFNAAVGYGYEPCPICKPHKAVNYI